MATEHQALCDREHTPRQACNENLAGVDAPAAVVTSPDETQPAGNVPEPPASAPAPEVVAVPDAFRIEEPILMPTMIALDDELDHVADDVAASRSEAVMPAPSIAAVQAWEDTAAAVGATATAAPPAIESDDASSHAQPGRGHALGLVVGAAAVFGLLVWLRRRG